MSYLITQTTDTLGTWRTNLNSVTANIGDFTTIYSSDGTDSFVHGTNSLVVSALNDLNNRKVKRSGDTIASLTVTGTLSAGAFNLPGGVADNIPYQISPGVTGFIAAPTTASTYLEWNGTAFVWGAVSSGNNINGGAANEILFQTAPNTTGFISAPTTATTYLEWNGTAFVWSAVAAGVSITDDNASNVNEFLVTSRITSGTMSTAYTASTKLTFNPSTGTLNATVFNSTSDLNLKTNIVGIKNGISVIDKLRGVEFCWKDNEGKSSGVIAQEIEKTLPHLVHHTKEGKSVNYNGLIGYLIEAVKELNKKIESMQ